MTADFLGADRDVISPGRLHLPDLGACGHVAAVDYPGRRRHTASRGCAAYYSRIIAVARTVTSHLPFWHAPAIFYGAMGITGGPDRYRPGAIPMKENA